MFRADSPYSPFFTSGLLATSSAPRRGSLPTLRSQAEFRSFLSLDLADSLYTKPTTIPSSPSLRSRFSRDSIRALPSPKPAPSIQLPDVPPRLPSLQPLPAIDLTTTTTTAPPKPSIKVSRTRVNPRMSIITKSSVSTSVRRRNRSDALARLEGRIQPVQPTFRRQNFMSMSDEEDDDESDDEPADSESDDDDIDFANVLNPMLEPEDVVLPLPSFFDAPHSAPLLSTHNQPSSRASVSRSSTRRKRTLKRTSNDWFPLKSFIDLHGDDDPNSTWSWRSFLQVSSLS